MSLGDEMGKMGKSQICSGGSGPWGKPLKLQDKGGLTVTPGKEGGLISEDFKSTLVNASCGV